MIIMDESTQTTQARNIEQQEPEENTSSDRQVEIANMDYSDYVSLLMESRII